MVNSIKGKFSDKSATRIVLKITNLHDLSGTLTTRWSQKKLAGAMVKYKSFCFLLKCVAFISALVEEGWMKGQIQTPEIRPLQERQVSFYTSITVRGDLISAASGVQKAIWLVKCRCLSQGQINSSLGFTVCIE